MCQKETGPQGKFSVNDENTKSTDNSGFSQQQSMTGQMECTSTRDSIVQPSPTNFQASTSALPTGNNCLSMPKGIKSFEAFRTSKGSEWKKRVSKKEKEKTEEVIITIGLLEWSEDEMKVKPKRGHRLALRVNLNDPYITILDKAQNKWKDYNSDTYNEVEYVLTYSNGKSAQFMPGTFDFFNLCKYKAEVGKDYKRIVFFLCTLEDHLLSENGGIGLGEDCEPAAKYQRNCDDYFSCVQNDVSVPEIAPTLACRNITEFGCQVEDSTSQCQVNGSNPPPPLEVRESGKTKIEPVLTYKEKLVNLREIFMGERNDSCQLAIRRRKIWLDTVQKLKHLFADGVKIFTMQFIGEVGVDAGGPTKEFFTLVFDEARKFLLCSGNGTGFTLLHDVDKVRKGDFRLFGNLVAVALLMECAGPRCFIPSVTSRLLNAAESRPTLEDIPDFEMQIKLQDLLSAANEEEFQAKMESFSERYMFGVTRVHVSFEDRDELVKDVAQHFCLSTCSDEIEEVRKGMEVMGLLQVLEQHFDESKDEFLVPSKDKASNILSLFTTIQYSEEKEQSSGQREQEEDIIYNFTNFLESLEHEGSLTLPMLEIEDDGSVVETAKEITLQEVARFCTGSRFVTSAMEGKGTICFDNTGRYGTVIANTCSMMLTFPIIDRYTTSPELFIQSLTEDMRNGQEFGMV